MSYYNTFENARKSLEELIHKYINSKEINLYLNILERQGYLNKKYIEKVERSFVQNLKNRIPEEDYNIICSGRKDNRKFTYNPIVLISKLEREKIKINKKPSFSNFTESLDILIDKINGKNNYNKYPYSFVIIFEGNGNKEAYEIPLIKIPEAYFILVLNKNNPYEKVPPKKGGKFINEFEINLYSYPKKELTEVYVEGYQDIGNFKIYSDSKLDRIQRMRKVKYKGEIYYTNVLGRAPLQALYTLNLLEDYKKFKVIVPDISLLKIISGIYRSILLSNQEIKLPLIFTYLMIHAEIEKRRKEGLDSFYITHYITDQKLEEIYKRLYPSIKEIESIISKNLKMKSVVS
ncbi:MAG: hypothetical protein QXG71_01805 [Nanopusillaceae archaeon]